MQSLAPEDMLRCRPFKTSKSCVVYDNTVEVYGKNIASTYNIGTWNVRSLWQDGKLENVMQEMIRMNIHIMGIAETFWNGEGDFNATLPGTDEEFRIIFSGGTTKRKGVAFILRDSVRTAIHSYYVVSERIISIKVRAKPVDLAIIQVYAPTNDAAQAEVEDFYEQIERSVKECKKSQDCLVIIGDFNGKVGDVKEDDIVGPFGLGQRNENGQSIVDCCRRHNLMIANTWYQTKLNARHTWIAPDRKTKNQIDYILVDKRYRNGIKNSKARPGADCGSDHKPVVAEMCIKLQREVNKKKDMQATSRWNTDILK